MDEGRGGVRPRVVVSVNMSVDGRVALRRGHPLMEPAEGSAWSALWPAGTPGVEAMRSEELERAYAPDAILEGSGSLVDAAVPTDLDAHFNGPEQELYADFLPASVRERPGRRKWFTVVDSRGRVRWTMKSRGEYDLLVLVARATPRTYLAYLRAESISYLVAGEEQVDLAAALRRMRERLGVTCVVRTLAVGSMGRCYAADWSMQWTCWSLRRSSAATGCRAFSTGFRSTRAKHRRV